MDAQASRTINPFKMARNGILTVLRRIRRLLWHLTAKTRVSLYIDGPSIKLVSARGKEIEKWASAPLEPGMVNDGLVVDANAVGDKVKDLFSDLHLKKKKVVVGLSGLHCLSRVVTLPSLPPSELREAIRREAERELPVPSDNLYLSWQVVRTSCPEVRVFIIAHMRNVVDALVNTLRRAGIRPYVMDLAPLALTRVMGKTTCAFVDVRSSDADIVITVDGVPEVIRSLPLPRGKTSEEKTSFVKREFDRTVAFYEATTRDAPLKGGLPVFVSGELANEAAIHQSLPGNPVYPAAMEFPPLIYPRNLVPGHYTVNIGLLLKKLKLSRQAALPAVDINALPEAYRYRPIHLSRTIAIAAGATAVGILTFIGFYVYDAYARHVGASSEVAQASQILSKKLTQQQSQNKEITELKKALSESNSAYSKLATAADFFATRQRIVGGNLPTAVKLAPKYVTLTRIKYAEPETIITGKATDEAQVLSYARELKQSRQPSEVIVANIQGAAKGGVGFTLILKNGGK
ncbi:MAG: pilus assembly protein PilM [Chloroflexi bacterium]|nr:pilus assembly protein PilM [Chloroflexota bacterium]